MNFVRLWREPTLGFTFEGGFAPRWFVHLGRVRAASQIQIQIRLQLRLHFAPRCALAGELLFSVAKKVTKNALYRRQLFEVLAGTAWGLGVWHRASISDLLVCAECSPCFAGDEWIPASMVMERGRGDRAGTGLLGDTEVGSSSGR